MSGVKVTMLPVGQGGMNLIEIYDDIGGEECLVNLTLIDCGFDRTRPVKLTSLPENNKKSVEYTVEKMKERQDRGDGVFLDNVLFTHRDTDHWIMFDNLWEELSGGEYSIRKTSPGKLIGNKFISKDKVDLSYFINTAQKTYEYQADFTSPCIMFQPYYEIWGKLSYQDDITKTSIHFINKRNNNACLANWIDWDMKIRLFSAKEDCDIMHAELVFEESPARFCGTWQNESFSWTSDLPFPENESMRRELFLNFINEVVGEKLGFEGILDIEEFLDQFEYISRQEIKDIVDSDDGYCDVIENAYVGGNPNANYTKNARLSGVGLMLQRLEILTKNAVIEMTATANIPLYDPLKLYVVERLSVKELTEIGGGVEGESVSSPAILNNGTSGVTVLMNTEDTEFLKFFFPGDATVHTFYSIAINDACSNFMNAVWTVPHHGSYTTNYGQCQNGEGQTIDLFPAMLGNTEPEAMVISAGLKSSHGHPNYTIVEWMVNYCEAMGKSADSHNICFNKSDTKLGDWAYTSKELPIYTILEAVDGKREIAYQAHCFTWDGDCYEIEYSKTEYCKASCSEYKKLGEGNQSQDTELLRTQGDGSGVPVPPERLFVRRH